MLARTLVVRSRRVRWCAYPALLAACLPLVAHAQVMRGVVADVSNRPLSGTVVALLDSAEVVVARSLTNERGEYRVAAPRSGTYRLRTLRIGYVPTLSPVFVLTEGGVTTRPITLDGVRLSLDAVRVVAKSSCGRQTPTELSAILAAWDQAMTSIASTSLASSARGLTATTMLIDRRLEPSGRKIRSQQASVRTDNVTQPWRSLPPETLRRRGYTETDAANWTTFNAPGLDVLVSSQFLEDHCIRLVDARDSTEIGVSFEPIAARRLRSEIRGTLWLGRSTAELRRLDFTFTGGATTVADHAAGGGMHFTRLPDGAVVISAWEIRMPVLTKDSPTSTRIRLSEVATTGGELVVMRRGTDTLFKRQPVNVVGVVLDSVSGKPLARATVSLVGVGMKSVTSDDGRFTISDVLPGEYAIAVSTPSLDSVRASSQSTIIVADGMAAVRLKVPTSSQLASALCGNTFSGVTGRGRGAVLGTVRDGSDTTALRGTRVVADWTEIDGTAGSLRRQSKRLETRTDSVGAYRLCGVPTEALLTLRALPDRGRSTASTLRLAPDERFVTQTLQVDRARMAGAAFMGVVVADSSQRVLADAEVAIPALALTTRSNAKGEFRIADIPVGTHEITVRRVGYGAMTAPITFAANDDEERRIVLQPLTVLDSVEVVASRIDAGMRDFEANRRVGLGHFLTRDQLQQREGQSTGNVLLQIPSIGLLRGRTSGAFIQSKRFVVPLSAVAGQGSSTIWQPSDTERTQGMVAGCYAQVYLDNQLMNPTQPTEPFDVNSIAPGQIEAIEYYASAAETPSRYAKLNSNCGVLVIHRRRFDGK